LPKLNATVVLEMLNSRPTFGRPDMLARWGLDCMSDARVVGLGDRTDGRPAGR